MKPTDVVDIAQYSTGYSPAVKIGKKSTHDNKLDNTPREFGRDKVVKREFKIEEMIETGAY